MDFSVRFRVPSGEFLSLMSWWKAPSQLVGEGKSQLLAGGRRKEPRKKTDVSGNLHKTRLEYIPRPDQPRWDDLRYVGNVSNPGLGLIWCFPEIGVPPNYPFLAGNPHLECGKADGPSETQVTFGSEAIPFAVHT